MANQFEDIRIVGLNEQASYKPDPAKALYDVVLDLSTSPPPEWAEYFNQRWQQKFYMMKRRARVSGDHLVIHCVPDELERDHLPQLREVIDETNAAYREHSAAQERRRRSEEQREEQERGQLRQLKDRLKFE